MADDGTTSKEADSSGEGGIWSGIKSLLFGEGEESSLRRELEEALDEYDEEAQGEAGSCLLYTSDAADE